MKATGRESFDSLAMSTWWEDPLPEAPHRRRYWQRLLLPVVHDRPASAIEQVAAAADFSSGGIYARLGMRSWSFMSTDLVVSLGRPPVGDWVGLDCDGSSAARAAARAPRPSTTPTAPWARPASRCCSSPDLDVITDREAIADLLAEYCHLCDDGEFEALADRFSEDGTFEFGEHRMTGRAELRVWLEATQPPERRGKHVTTNVRITVDVDRATVVSDFVFLVKKDGRLVPLLAGRYDDDLERVRRAVALPAPNRSRPVALAQRPATSIAAVKPGSTPSVRSHAPRSWVSLADVPSSESSASTRLWWWWCSCSAVKPMPPSTCRARSHARRPLRPASALSTSSYRAGAARRERAAPCG